MASILNGFPFLSLLDHKHETLLAFHQKGFQMTNRFSGELALL